MSTLYSVDLVINRTAVDSAAAMSLAEGFHWNFTKTVDRWAVVTLAATVSHPDASAGTGELFVARLLEDAWRKRHDSDANPVHTFCSEDELYGDAEPYDKLPIGIVAQRVDEELSTMEAIVPQAWLAGVPAGGQSFDTAAFP